MRKYRPKLGDRLFTTEDIAISRLIRWASRHTGEKPTLASHTGPFKSRTTAVEAQAKGVVETVWSERRADLLDGSGEYCIMRRRKALRGLERKMYRKALMDTVGKPYGFLELPALLVDGLLGKVLGITVIWLRKLGDVFPNTMVCSKAAALPDIAIGELPEVAQYWTPDGLYDHSVESDNWEVAEYSPGWYTRFTGDKT